MGALMAVKLHHSMAKLYHKIAPLDIRWRLFEPVTVIREFLRVIWRRILSCSITTGGRYRRLSNRAGISHSPKPVILDEEAGGEESCSYGEDTDLVTLKIAVLGDCLIGKSSFVSKYVGAEEETKGLQMSGLSIMSKTSFVQGAGIAFDIWDVGGKTRASDHVSMACRDAVAILFMFDLTSRCTLNSVVEWFAEARKWNKVAIPILIGNKFEEFVKLPPDVQSLLITQARGYARTMRATLFFSSTRHNINVNKVFKFVIAKAFNLPWKLERNLTIGEPIIDF